MKSTTNVFIDGNVKSTDQAFYNDMCQLKGRRFSVESDDILDFDEVQTTALNWMLMDVEDGFKIVSLHRDFSAERGVIITYMARRK